jgi:VWFA-related protein
MLSVLAQSSAQQTFRGGVERVLVDITATGADGRPVTDLVPADLTLKVDGEIRAISSLDFIQVGPTAEERREAASGRRVAPPFASNLPDQAGRTIIFVFNHEAIRRSHERAARDAAAGLLDLLSPRDRVGLVTMPFGRVEVDLTTEHDRIRQALGRIVGRGEPATSCAGRGIDGRDVLRPLAEFIEGLAGTDEPKTVLFISEGVPPFDDVYCTPEFDRIARAAHRSRVTLYTIQPLGLIGPASEKLSSDASGYTGTSDGLRDLAGVTGGEYVHLAGSADDEFARIERRTTGYYLLGFEPRPSEWDGRRHSINVETTRRDVTVLARPVFTAPPPAAAESARPASSTPDAAVMLRDVHPYRDLPLRAAAYAFRDAAPNRLKILVALDEAGDAGAPVSAAFGIFDPRGRQVAEWQADRGDLGRWPIVTASIVRPGLYRLRAAAVDAAGRRGAVDYDFTAELVAAVARHLGSMMLGVVERGAFAPRLEFTTETEGTAFLEVYGAAPGSQPPTIRVDVVGPDDATRTSLDAVVAPTRQPGRWTATAAIDLAALPPGDYVVRAALRQGSTDLGAVERTLRKAVRPR